MHRWLGLLGGGRTDADLEDELRAHVELASEAAPGRASGAATRRPEQPASVPSALEALRDQRGLPCIESLVRDVRHGVRLLGASRAFTAVALLTLTLGIGANAAVYQLLDAIRLRALPVKDPHDLVILQLADVTRWTGRRTIDYPALTNAVWEELRDRHRDLFAGLLAWSYSDMALGADASGGRARALFVSGEFFQVLGVEPRLGRLFDAADDRPGCGVHGVVISHDFWERQLGRSEAAIGKTLLLSGREIEIVGVTPATFRGLDVGRSYDVAVPICAHETLGREPGWLTDGTIWWLTVMARLDPRRPIEVVDARLGAESRAVFAATTPANDTQQSRDGYLSLRLTAVPAAGGVSRLRTRFGDPLLVLMVTTGLVLLVACSNLANLILARASAREREFAVRLALGASWGRLVQQLMVENALVAAGGAALGLAAAPAFSRVLVSLLGPGIALDMQVDSRVTIFTATLAALTCVTFGAIPAWHAARVPAVEAMKAGSRSVAGPRAASRLRQALVVAQIGLSLVLLFGATLFAGTLRNLLDVDAGFQATGVAIARVDFSRTAMPANARPTFKREALDRLRGIPGVSAAAEIRHVPLSGTGSSLRVWPRDGDPSLATTVRLNAMSDGYLQTMNIRLLSGRDFAASIDTPTSPNVAIVNEAFRRRLNLPSHPVGERFRAEKSTAEPDAIFEIVGFVGDTKYFTLREDATPIVFVPIGQIDDPRSVADFVVRSASPLETLVPDIRRTVTGLGPVLRADVQTLDVNVRAGLLRERLLAAISGFFGVLAALIAAIGLYGGMSYLVRRRTSEIGLRIALGAASRQILAMVLRQAIVLVGIGVALGSVLALGLGRSVQSLVFGVQPHDIAPLVVASAVLTAVALVASYLPARRAARMQPLSALRDE